MYRFETPLCLTVPSTSPCRGIPDIIDVDALLASHTELSQPLLDCFGKLSLIGSYSVLNYLPLHDEQVKSLQKRPCDKRVTFHFSMVNTMEMATRLDSHPRKLITTS